MVILVLSIGACSDGNSDNDVNDGNVELENVRLDDAGQDEPGQEDVELDDSEQDELGQEDAEQNEAGQEDVELDDAVDETEALFDPARLIDIRIEIDPADWDVLRYEGRGFPTLYSGCKEDLEYTYFDATATIDGEKLENVAVRKKGFLGSLSAIRPSLKINFGKYSPGQTYSGMKRMTLNNDRQDPSHTHQIMSYALFRKAGVAAPRCNLARVTVNGEDLGIYSHVEAIKKSFLDRHFDDKGGNLYGVWPQDYVNTTKLIKSI